MSGLLCGASLGALLFFLVWGFHSFVWNVGVSSNVGLQCWASSFEWGFVSQRVTENYFSHTYFVLLVFFVVFDLKISLLLNMPLQGVLYNNFGFYVLFLCLLVSGFGVEIWKGYAEWSY
uniref:NADH-ubiquinone oxidoreductase chain 3 n=1 Tax=Paragonimus westermani complex sp. type 1 TaxID=1586379 RepID=A0A0K0LGA8_9TREM|nr:NADH dehydrogenase subunit 3 [Paragonimus westermani complex sp. type 1]AJA32734.1 NADH dehydrogenase subunit 3 [Paragonimus westermani complex sp. type 1]